MHRIAFLLAFQFAVLSTQPVWQPLKQVLFGSCGASTCSTTAMACAGAPTLPDNKQDGQSAKGCCAPFQCCFPCCCYCQATAQLPDFTEINDNARPNEEPKALHSIHLGEHFQPPEFA